tara:strand:+ start:572 stop:1102 length:531 start_codon:yes stop_codon:yes gene_type:complete
MSELRTNRIIPRDGLVSGANGGIIQVAVTQKSDVFTWGTTGDVAITGMSVSITPTRSDSKILVQVQIGASGVHENAYPIFWQLYKNGSQISGAKGSGTSGSTVKCASYTKNYVYYTGTSTSFSFLDSPSTTSATTYQLYGQRHSSSGTAYFNATAQQINERYAESISTITAMEISG